MKLLLQHLTDSQLFDLHEAVCSLIEARHRGQNPGRVVRVSEDALQLYPTYNSTRALALAHSRWGHVKLHAPKKRKRGR